MTETHADYRLSQLDQLEAESIHIFREVAAEFEKPVLMFSGGKDSIVMMRLAENAFYPAKITFPVLQVDTGFDLPEVMQTRDNRVHRLGIAWGGRIGVRTRDRSRDRARTAAPGGRARPGTRRTSGRRRAPPRSVPP